MDLFTVDGMGFPGVAVVELKRSANVLDGENAGRSKSGRMIRDIIGTYYNYSVTLDPIGLDVTTYDQLYEVLTAPVDSHTVSFPYGQSTLSFEAYVTTVNDSLVIKNATRTRWGGLTVNFVAMEPQRT